MDDDDLMTANHEETDPSPVAPVGESRTEKSALRIFRAIAQADFLVLRDIAGAWCRKPQRISRYQSKNSSRTDNLA